MSYVVTATFKVKTGAATRFSEKMSAHATASLGEEGCQVFDICRNVDHPDLFLLYEVYTDDTAYLSHRETPHYLYFREWAPPLVEPNDGEIYQSRSVWQGR